MPGRRVVPAMQLNRSMGTFPTIRENGHIYLQPLQHPQKLGARILLGQEGILCGDHLLHSNS